jgi:inner membrane protein YidH
MKKTPTSLNLSEERTNWAHERTRLAKERTFAAWLRTGLSTMAVGFALVKFLPSVEPRWLLRLMGLLFVSAGGTLFVLGYRTYHVTIKKLEREGFRGIPSALMGVLTAVFVLCALLGCVLIILD